MTKDLITLSDPRSAEAEAYRSLRTNLIFNNAAKPISTLMIASTNHDDDKSRIAANLAITFAQIGHKTILVDADLRNPTQSQLWGLNASQGLTTMIQDDGAMSTPPLHNTSVANLQVLTTGPLPDSPADILGSQRMRALIGVLKARAAYVIFDVPPVLAATDAPLLASQVDGVLLVVRAGHTRRDDALRSRQALDQVQANILGVTLTNAPKAQK
jgi:capsular exopolysaccharide synthesis family protein